MSYKIKCFLPAWVVDFVFDGENKNQSGLTLVFIGEVNKNMNFLISFKKHSGQYLRMLAHLAEILDNENFPKR
ncbi:PTS sugar transporter subunit IIA [Cyclobacterium plantarum]|uniref:Uncharacterized protein n=1 Tax=Cyclobacterium plantarum TaxID=2716263 RepID=A0ABX0H4S8_9BACT|nr:hypothetical protein [Cyclobacterium plantarum]NHE56849.1 hypothetical protein [Cyclobacterium plantarum]